MKRLKTLLLCALAAGTAHAQGTRLLRTPTVSDTRIAFVHANDVWTVPRAGGDAVRLTSAEGAETDPRFSPDGRWIAFTGQYAGNTDVFVVAAVGGQPVRLTFHPSADYAMGWTPDGRVLFQSGRAGVPTRLTQMYAVPVSGGFPEMLPIPQAWDGRLSPDGSLIAYHETGFWDPEWRNYRGGQAQPIRVVSLSDFTLWTPEWEGERQTNPHWLGDVVYFVSERDWAGNVWSFDTRTGETRQRTFHRDFDVKSLSTGGGVVVYEQGGYLHELDPSTGRTRRIEIRVAGDLNWARPRWEEVPAARLSNARLSATGRRALFEYRGDLFTVPAEEGSWRNITRTPGVADRHAAWSPDGTRIAWFNDASGRYGLSVADQDGSNRHDVALSSGTFFFVPDWSPDSKRLAFTDTDYRVLVLDVESGRLTHVDTDRYAHPERSMNPVWSPDGRYLAWSRRLDTQLRAVFVHDTETGERHQVTDGMADAIDPVWDASGDWLYFLASTDYALNTGWLDMSSYDRPVTRSLYLALLRKDVKSPFLPKSDEEEPKPDENSDEGEDGDAEEGKKREGDSKAGDDDDEGRDADAAGEGTARGDTTAGRPIDFDGIEQRIVDAPGLPARAYTGIVRGPEGQVFVVEAVPNESGSTLRRYDVKEREQTEFMTGVGQVTASHDRKKLLVRSGSSWSIVSATGGPPKASDGRLELGGIRYRVDPAAEWAQMLRDGWRFMRDFLYVDNVHGAPWDDVWEWYSPWLASVHHRSDFNYLLDMVSGEVAIGHSYVSGGDYPDIEGPETGLLGADIAFEGGGYRIERIFTGESWNPGLAGPLSLPGMDVKEGDYLVSIDGVDLTPATNPFMLLEGTAARTIRIRVNERPSPDGAREILVVPTPSEGALRQWAWVEGNRRRVDEMSGGRLAYVWLPNTGRGGYTYFNRYYFAQQDRAGAVVDERNNGGGSAADYFADVMSRRLRGYFNSRAGDRKPWTQPMAGLFGPKVMIINERAGSGGDLLPYFFRDYGIGPLVGTRTWGGLVGTWDTPPLIDGGRIVAPRGGFFDARGAWAVEGEGVAPDIEVQNRPADVVAGRDPQLEAAVREALRLIETEGVRFMPEPPPPVRWKRPGRN